MHFFIDLSTGHLIDTRGVPGRAYARIPHTKAGHNGHARLSHIVDIMHARLLLADRVPAGARSMRRVLGRHAPGRAQNAF